MGLQTYLATVNRAKAGDRAAWDSLCRELWPRWVRDHHGALGDTLRRVWNTEDLVQSAIAEAIRDAPNLRIEAAFYAWVSAIVRRKVAEKRRISNRLPAVSLHDFDAAGCDGRKGGGRAGNNEDTMQVLDALLALFPSYPEHMAALYLRYFAKKRTASITALFGRSQRSTERTLHAGLLLLKSQLDA